MLGQVLAALGLSLTDGPADREARSGAGVYGVTTRDGQRAILKLTTVDQGDTAWSAARREAAVYQELVPIPGVRTPELLAVEADDESVALVLAYAGSPPYPSSLPPGFWHALGTTLAQLHRLDVPDHELWRRPDPLTEAAKTPDQNLLGRFWRQDLPEWQEIGAASIDLLPRAEPVFTHGDLHLANVLLGHDPVAPGLCDWQQAGHGRRTADLAFVNARLAPEGLAAPPVFLTAYATATGLAPDELARQVAAEELAILLLQWPSYAVFHPATAVAHVRRRAVDLAGRLGVSGPTGR